MVFFPSNSSLLIAYYYQILINLAEKTETYVSQITSLGTFLHNGSALLTTIDFKAFLHIQLQNIDISISGQAYLDTYRILPLKF